MPVDAFLMSTRNDRTGTGDTGSNPDGRVWAAVACPQRFKLRPSRSITFSTSSIFFRSAGGSNPDGGARPTLLAQNSHGSSDTAYGLWLSHIGGRRILVTERRGSRCDPIVREQGAAEDVEQDFEAIKSAMSRAGFEEVDSGKCGKGSS